MTDTEGAHVMWVRTTVDPTTGEYLPVIDVSDDVSIPMDRRTAARHAAAMTTIVADGTHDAAVAAELRELIGDAGTGIMIASLREAREEPEWPTRLSFTSGVSAFTGRPFCNVALDGKTIGQFGVREALDHASAVQMAVRHAEIDNNVHEYLTGTLSLTDDEARGFIAALDVQAMEE